MTSSQTSTGPNYPACLADMSAASLFIGELMPHVNEVILYKKFAPMGTVTSVKLCRDWITGKSLCYAYVNFENPAEAEKAYRTLNYELLEGQPMRIMKSTRNPWLENRDEGCCYHHHHHHHHPPCCNGSGNNNANTAKELMDPQALVEAIESYSRAFKDADEHKAPTGYKYSREFLKRMNIANTQYTNVFIKNFKDLLDDYKLYKLCKPFGEVISAKVMVNEYGISKGFGFACFTDSDAAQRAVNKLNGLVLDGRTLYAGPALTKSERVKDWQGPRNDYDDNYNNYTAKQPETTPHVSFSPRICIRNLRDVVDEVRLRREFERFGPVQQVELLTDNEGRSKGTGYVMYEDQADAIKAVNSMNGKMIYGTRIGVSYVPYTATAATNTYTDNFLSSLGADDTHIKTTSRDNSSSGHCGKDSGDNNESGSGNVFLQLKELATTLGHKGHPVNIKDIDKRFNAISSSPVNRNASNNSEINTSNNAVKVASTSTSTQSDSLSTTLEECSNTTATTMTGGHTPRSHDDIDGNSNNRNTFGSTNNNNKNKIMDNNNDDDDQSYHQNHNINHNHNHNHNHNQLHLHNHTHRNNSSTPHHIKNNHDDDNVNNDIDCNNGDKDSDNNDIVVVESGSGSMNSNVNASSTFSSSSSTLTLTKTSTRTTATSTSTSTAATATITEETTCCSSSKDLDSDETRSGEATLLVKNLDESITDYKLESLFNVYGTVVSAKVISNEFGVSKGFGFVIMSEADDAVRAIKTLDGRIVVNRPIYISPTVQTRLYSK